jgi:hypothetical protein
MEREFNGIKFRKTGKYYRPSGADCKRGVESLHREIWKYYRGEIPDGYHVHHMDGDTDNNAITNLSLIEGWDHLSMHGKRKTTMPAECLEAAKKWHRSEEGETVALA